MGGAGGGVVGGGRASCVSGSAEGDWGPVAWAGESPVGGRALAMRSRRGGREVAPCGLWVCVAGTSGAAGWLCIEAGAGAGRRGGIGLFLVRVGGGESECLGCGKADGWVAGRMCVGREWIGIGVGDGGREGREGRVGECCEMDLVYLKGTGSMGGVEGGGKREENGMLDIQRTDDEFKLGNRERGGEPERMGK